MSLTRTEYLREIRAMADATSSARWTDATITVLLNSVFKREWSRILNANRYYRVGERTVTLDASGRFALSSLTSGSGNTVETFYKIIGVNNGEAIYAPAELRDNMLTASLGQVSAAQRTFWRVGSEVQCYPYTSGESIDVVVNYLPCLPGSLSSDSDTVDYPEGYETVLIYETAAAMLMKGGAETDASADFKAIAEEVRGDMLADISRMTTDPTQMRYNDSSIDWAG